LGARIGEKLFKVLKQDNEKRESNDPAPGLYRPRDKRRKNNEGNRLKTRKWGRGGGQRHFLSKDTGIGGNNGR